MPEIIVKLGDSIVQKNIFLKEPIRIGRVPDNDIVVENLAVSRYHASIEYQDSRYILTDQDSANGTFVNGVRIKKTELQDRDVITIGKHKLYFYDQRSPAENRSRPAFDADRTPTEDPGVPAPQAELEIVKGRQKGTRFIISGPQTSIGRGSFNDIQLTDWFVSKVHAVIERRGCEFVIRDLGSWRHTYINGIMVHELPLADGDMIQMGPTVQLAFALARQDRDATTTAAGRVPQELAPEALAMPEDRPAASASAGDTLQLNDQEATMPNAQQTPVQAFQTPYEGEVTARNGHGLKPAPLAPPQFNIDFSMPSLRDAEVLREPAPAAPAPEPEHEVEFLMDAPAQAEPAPETAAAPADDDETIDEADLDLEPELHAAPALGHDDELDLETKHEPPVAEPAKVEEHVLAGVAAGKEPMHLALDELDEIFPASKTPARSASSGAEAPAAPPPPPAPEPQPAPAGGLEDLDDLDDLDELDGMDELDELDHPAPSAPAPAPTPVAVKAPEPEPELAPIPEPVAVKAPEPEPVREAVAFAIHNPQAAITPAPQPEPAAAIAAQPEAAPEAAPAAADPNLIQEILLWERALKNKNPIIRKQAARQLFKLTGKQYDIS